MYYTSVLCSSRGQTAVNSTIQSIAESFCYCSILSEDGMQLVVHAQSLRHVQLYTTPGISARHTRLSWHFPGKKYLSGLPFPPPGHLPHQGIEPLSAALIGGFFTTVPSGKPHVNNWANRKI